MYDRAGRQDERLPQEKRVSELSFVIVQPNQWLSEAAVGKLNSDLRGRNSRGTDLRPQTVKS